MKYIETYTKDEWALELLHLDDFSKSVKYRYIYQLGKAYGKIVDSREVLCRRYGPAISSSTSTLWYREGMYHRVGLPAYINIISGTYTFHFYDMSYSYNGDGPTIITVNSLGEIQEIVFKIRHNIGKASTLAYLNTLYRDDKITPNGLVHTCLVEACGDSKSIEEMISDVQDTGILSNFETSMRDKCQELAPYWYETRYGLYDIGSGLVPTTNLSEWLDI